MSISVGTKTNRKAQNCQNLSLKLNLHTGASVADLGMVQRKGSLIVTGGFMKAILFFSQRSHYDGVICAESCTRCVCVCVCVCVCEREREGGRERGREREGEEGRRRERGDGSSVASRNSEGTHTQ